MKQKILLINFLKFFIIAVAGLLISEGPFSFAQDQGAEQTEAIQEDHDTKKLDQVLEEYNKDSQKVLKDAEVIQQMQDTGEVSEAELDKGQLIDADYEKSYQKAQNILNDALGKGKNKKKQDLKTIKYSEAIKTAIAPLQKLSEPELLSMIKENTRETPVHVYLDSFPKILLFAVRLIKDQEAIPSLVEIVDDQDRLIRFGGLMIATILIGFFLKRFMAREGRSWWKATGLWFLRFFIMLSFRFAIIYLFFGRELTPAFNVALRTFY